MDLWLDLNTRVLVWRVECHCALALMTYADISASVTWIVGPWYVALLYVYVRA
jgi:hypothetical protein